MVIADLRKEVKAIIAVNPYEVEIERSETVEDEFGGVTKTNVTLPPQTMRVAELSHSESERLRNEGLALNHIVNVTAEHNADIKQSDKFLFCGNKFVVLFMRKISYGGYSDDCIYKKSGRAEEINEE